MDQVVTALSKGLLVGEKRPDLLRDETLADILRDSASRLPEKTALHLIGRGDQLSYAELDAKSDRVAAALAAHGVKRGDFVGLWFTRSLDLHVAMIGIAKSGAAFIPFDADVPADRVATSLDDCGGRILLTHAPKAEEAAKVPVTVLDLADMLAASETVEPQGPTPDSPAYAIYTSGSTGKPKGIVISHRNITQYLRAGNEAIGMREDDVVFQGASVAFDLSMEEIWIPYLLGATLKVAPSCVLKNTDTLPDVLAREGITVLDVVPTLLTMLDRDVPNVRLIVTGGEAMTTALVERWAAPERRIVNTYGPTETTVVATFDECAVGQPITIGKPIANYTAYVLNEQLEPVGVGETGELVVGGPGVAQGYINLPQMTAAKFIDNPFGSLANDDPVLYRTGDAVSIDEEGRLLFHGRIDDQVKIRGYRIELGEIEALIAGEPGVKTAAVAVHKDDAGGDVLVAHVAPTDGSFDTQAVKKALGTKLPPYMVPHLWQLHVQLPQLISGKVDRKTLAAMKLDLSAANEPQEEPQSATEALLLGAARTVFPGQSLPFDADFFTELGGHSLLAARFISAVRKTPELASITLQDVYAQRTLRNLGRLLDERTFKGAGLPPEDFTFTPPPFMRRFWCGVAQTVAMPFILAISTAQWLGVFLTYMMVLQGEDYSFGRMALVLSLAYCGVKFGSMFLVVALKWLIIGRTRPGHYPLWGSYYFRWWLVARLYALAYPSYLSNSPLIRVYLRLLGAKVGHEAMISHCEIGAPDLVEIGNWTAIGHKAVLSNAEVVGNTLIIGRIKIEDGAFIGNQAIIPHDTVIGHDARVEDLTALQPGINVAPYEIWDGSPARQTGMVSAADLEAVPQASLAFRAGQFALYTTLVIAISAIGLLPIFPAFFVFDKLESFLLENVSALEWQHVLFPISWLMGMALVVFTMAFVVALRWMVLPTRLKEGVYSIYSGVYLRKWVLNLVIEVSLDTLSSLYATVYMRGWYRLMGAKIGKGAEISTNIGGRFDLVSIGGKSFMADECSLGDEDIHRGWMTLKQTNIGERVFVGNNAVIGPGVELADGTLIGVKSKAPDSGITGEDETWFGSPPIKFPVRQQFGDMASVWTFEPPAWRKYVRAAFEALHTTLPTALFITLGSITVDYIEPYYTSGKYLPALGVFMLASVLMPVIMVLVVAAIKWGLMGRYAPRMQPMWSFWAMKTEAVAVLYWGLGGRVLLEHLRGTWMLPLALRLFGTKVGKGVFMDTTDLTEFDCCTIGDFAAINSMSCLQTHLYEDRLMKIGRVHVGTGVTIGTFTTVLYDTEIGDFARLGSLSLIMKGENIPANSSWAGAPAQPMVALVASADTHVAAAA